MIELYDWNLNDTKSIIKEILSKFKNRNDIWILTYTNDETLEIKSILDKLWEDSEVIQNENLYKMKHILELNYFFKHINSLNKQEFSESEIWKAFWIMQEEFWENINTKKIKLFLKEFIQTNINFLLSDLNDFFDEVDINEIIENKRIKISTLHKSKWKEFESVAIIRNKKTISYSHKESERMVFYVWLTRAKNDILVFWKNQDNFFEELKEQKTKISFLKTNDYNFKKSLSLNLWLSDVFLSMNKADRIKKKLLYKIWEKVILNEYLDTKIKDKYVQKLSKKWKIKIEEYIKKWYKVKNIEISQRLIYRPKGADEDYLVYLFFIDIEKNR